MHGFPLCSMVAQPGTLDRRSIFQGLPRGRSFLLKPLRMQQKQPDFDRFHLDAVFRSTLRSDVTETAAPSYTDLPHIKENNNAGVQVYPECGGGMRRATRNHPSRRKGGSTNPVRLRCTNRTPDPRRMGGWDRVGGKSSHCWRLRACMSLQYRSR